MTIRLIHVSVTHLLLLRERVLNSGNGSEACAVSPTNGETGNGLSDLLVGRA